MYEIYEMIKSNPSITALIIFILSIFIECTPIKINPWSLILNTIGKKMNGDTEEKLELISVKIADVQDRLSVMEVNDMRSKILSFANDCIERKHTKEEFDHIIDLHTQYDEIISKRGMKNGRVDLAYKYVCDIYAKSLREGTFLSS